MFEWASPNPKPQESPKAAEIKRSISENISGTTKYLISSGIILLILIVVVGQELREYRKKQAAYVRQIVSTATSERVSANELGKKFSPIQIDLGKKPSPQTATAQEVADRQPATDGVNRSATVVRQGQKPEERPNLSQILGVQGEDIPHRLGRIHDTNELDALVKDEGKLSDVIRHAEGELEKKKKEEPRKAQMEEAWKDADDLVTNLKDYRKQYSERIGLVRALLIYKKESEELRAAKKSIPTPFGSFQIAPRLALLGLAFAVLLTYLPFLSSVRKIRRLANEYSDATARLGLSPFRIPAPFWSPNPDPGRDLSSTAKSSRALDTLLSVALHVIWLSLAVWLTYESVVTWNATKALAFDFKSFWGSLLVVTLAVTVFAAVWQYVPARWKRISTRPKKSDGYAGTKLTRRHLGSLAALGAIGILTVGLFRLLRKQKGPRAERQKPSYFGSAPEFFWIQNKRKRKTIHFGPSCVRHLPIRANRLEIVAAESPSVHAGCQIRILEDMGTRAIRPMLLRRMENQGRDRLVLTPSERESGNSAITCFLKAIELSPLSLHLYDSLCKTYGTLEYFDKIPPLYKQGLKNASDRIAELGNAKQPAARKRLESLRRAEKAFNSRIERTNRRTKAKQSSTNNNQTAEIV